MDNLDDDDSVINYRNEDSVEKKQFQGIGADPNITMSGTKSGEKNQKHDFEYIMGTLLTELLKVEKYEEAEDLLWKCKEYYDQEA